ncbi:MAG: ribosome biogenesis GTP-binding protein YihA/YsxC [Muribaculaceae bacterium]|nr:ribosome biogenesis GTP-binding protein YihA/YsxC [Muribaculaceae bacterium]MDE5934670.1 ribosome biogenesis GTP-binding protein YihA/YsxC [Muribaculaceae bacterium]MDE6165376.1 ribosome biogenesis GTP-binding protein YihA/YsxC [Muribaculaceae bacterium]MDE6344085.1 ribosome biogenesis GTP-binding protein YihA/YsxC [Muribaculaceae bacterium]MDE6503433.1 ribosome biogenesis GTP-binding protein YihA/YsxC [Muribaculaceae bacterium]
MIIDTARFITSSPDLSRCPEGDSIHEYAFIGRSNVGKSSLINMLTGRKDLAKTSSKPGKTAQINYFMVNEEWYLVDLPGYGYAERSKSDRAAFEKMIRQYILGRRQMTNLFLLIDGRHKPQRIDIDFMQWLGENGVPFSIVFTKLDKLSSAAAKKSVEVYLESLLEEWEELPPVFRTSSVDRRGKQEILDYIDEMNGLPLEADD